MKSIDPAGDLASPALAAVARPAAKKKMAAKRAAARPAGPEFNAPFAGFEVQPVDAPAWPVHPVSWFQPDRAPAIPAWTGLNVERRYRIPVPDFLHPDTTPPDRSASLDRSRSPIVANVRLRLPGSGLDPLGWDPRAARRKEETK